MPELSFGSAFSVCIRAVPEIILGGGGPQALFCPVGGGCFVDNVSEGWGWVGVTCPGGQGIFDPWWSGLIQALTCPGGRGGGSDSMCVLGVEGSEKKCGSPEDNFWNSPYRDSKP